MAVESAAAVLDQLLQWIEDYNTEASHSSLGMRSPREYRQQRAATQPERTD